MVDSNKGWIEDWNFLPETYPEIGVKVYALLDSSALYEPVVAEIFYLGKDSAGVDTFSLKNVIDEDSYIPQCYNVLMWRKIN